MDALANDFYLDSGSRDRRPVFLQEWWLATARNAMVRPYREIRVVRDGSFAGYLGYSLKKNRIGIRSWEAFDWCRVNEPVLCQDLSPSDKASVLRELMAQLPKDVSFEFVCGPTARDLPLIIELASEAGFAQRRETVFWEQPETSKNILQRVNKRYRQSIKKAAADLQLVDLSPRKFVRLYEANLKSAQRRPYSDPAVAERLITAAINRRQPQGRIFAVKKRNAPPQCSAIDAAIACVWDDERYYYWLTTCSRFTDGEGYQKAHTHAVKYLLVQAIQDAGERKLIFDTDSGDTEGAAKQFLDLKFAHRAERIVFMRHTLPLRLYNNARQKLQEIAGPPERKPQATVAPDASQAENWANLRHFGWKRHSSV